MNRILYSLLLLLLSFSHLAPVSGLLQETQIKSTLDTLIEYHIESNEMTSEILLRSLKKYILSFDHHKSYLLQDEVSSITQSNEIKKRLIKNYKNNNINHYIKINDLIRDSILRAKTWRQEWLKDPLKLLSEAQGLNLLKKQDEWPISLDNLQSRHKELVLSYIAIHLEDIPQERYLGRELDFINLCLKQIENLEQPYLGLDEYNSPLSSDESNHLFYTRIIKALANSLDAHTAYFSKEEASFMRVQLEKGMCGIGVVLKEDMDGVIVKEIIKGGPAALNGLLSSGDIIHQVDHQSIKNIPFKKVLDILKGKEGSNVTLHVQHINGSQEAITLTRSKIFIEDRRVDVSYEPYGDGILGKITLYSFYEGENNVSSEQDLRKAINELREMNLKGLVLDIRENNGGFLSQAVKVAGLFMTNGVAVVSKYSDGSIKRYRTMSLKKFYDGPLIVLVSKNSASAAEIIAQTLQDYGLALVVGDEHTYGKGSIQHQTITSNQNQEDFFKVTIGKYYSPSGKSPQLEGVISDIIIPTVYAEEHIGEKFLENPLSLDTCINVLDDNLEDLDNHTASWFKRYYIPNLQKKEDQWTAMLPTLIHNSNIRIQNNKNYNLFLETIQYKTANKNFGVNDLQMEESINILKDMLLLSNIKRP